MKKYSILLFIVLSGSGIFTRNDELHAQSVTAPDHRAAALDFSKSSLLTNPDTTKPVDTSKKVQSLDTVLFDMYGNLRVDDPLYNKKAPWYVPALNIVGQEILLNLADQYLLNFDWARVGLKSWGSNLTAGAPWGNGWIWDDTRFANDMFLHPYTGANYFDAARASGYNFWESSIYTFGGSYFWKIFGENGAPERNSLIYTTLGGIFGGEIMYRLSSNILDDRTSGLERIARETLAGILSPSRFATRLFDGKLSHVTEQEVYKKEPLNVTIYAGEHIINDNSKFLSGNVSELLNLQFDYGNPFERIDRKPYDFFKILAEANIGEGRKIIDDITGYGLLVGSNSNEGKFAFLSGVFQNYDYWDNPVYELTTLGFGPGVVARLPVLTNASWYSVLHLDVVPFGGNSKRAGPDTSQIGDFNFGGGAEGKFESTLSFGNTASFKLIANYYWFHTYVGEAGNNFITILKPRVTVGIFDNVSVGVEESIYSSVRDSPNFGTIRTVNTEQKIFLMIYLEDSQRGGHYN
jgi:Domain of unknown function (DUF3943)